MPLRKSFPPPMAPTLKEEDEENIEDEVDISNLSTLYKSFLNRRLSLPAKAFEKTLITTITLRDHHVEPKQPTYQKPSQRKLRRSSTGSMDITRRPATSIPRRHSSKEVKQYTGGGYNPGFVSILPPEKTKAWHFSSHERSLVQAGIDPREFNLTNLPTLRDRYSPDPASTRRRTHSGSDDVRSSVIEEEDETDIVSRLNSPEPPSKPKPKGVGLASRAFAFARKTVKPKTWEDEVSVDVKPFTEYFRNIQQHSDEHLDYEEQQRRRRSKRPIISSTVQTGTSVGDVFSARSRLAGGEARRTDNALVIRAAYSLTSSRQAPIYKQTSDVDGDTNNSDIVSATDLDKSRHKLLSYIGKLTTAQIIKGREQALKELGLGDQSMSNWSNTMKSCSYIQPTEDTDIDIFSISQ